MKLKTAFLPALALALALSALTPQVRAQVVEGAPAYIDYQGMVFDGTATNKPLGSSGTGTDPNPYVADPTNYTMQFKIYSAQSGGTLIWAETQTVTVSLGAFAVRLGSGASISGLSPAPTKTKIAEAFDGKERYLELTVIPTGASNGTAITPRLAFQASPFSFVAQRAVLADTATLASSVNGVVTATAGSTFKGTFEGSGDFTGGNFFGGEFNFGDFFGGFFIDGIFNGDGSGLTGLDAGKITGGVLPIARGGTGSSTKNFVDLSNPQTIGGTKKFTGNVGIGNDGIGPSTPQASLTIEAQGTTPVMRLQDLNKFSNYWWDFSAHNGTLELAAGGGGTGSFSWATGAYSSGSDRSLKKNIEPLSPSLDRLLQLEPVSYHFKAQEDDAPVSFGFIAQDVQPLFPEVVKTMASGKLGLTYSELIPITVAALQELKSEKDAEVKALQEENSALRASLAAQEKRLAAQEKRLAALEAKDQARDAQLARFEKLLDATPDLQPVTTVLSR